SWCAPCSSRTTARPRRRKPSRRPVFDRERPVRRYCSPGTSRRASFGASRGRCSARTATGHEGERMAMLEPGEAQRRLGYHPANDATRPGYETNRAAAILLFELWNQALPPGREAALALTALQDAMMWANAAIACNVGDDWQRPAVDVAELV